MSGAFPTVVRVVAGAVVNLLAIAGCSAGGGDASSSSTAEVSETSTTALPPLEYETPPQYPDDMEVDSGENATRFVQFAIETLNYAQRFNDVEAIQAIAVPECTFCNTMIETFSSFRDAGLRRVGVELSCTVTGVEYQPATGLFYLDSDCNGTEGQTYDRQGQMMETIEASTYPITWIVTMIDGPWQLVDAGSAPEADSP